jgi:hypothetical protein
MVRLVASDLDGTLLRSDGEVDLFTRSTFRELEALGIQIVLATARHHLDAARFRDALGTSVYMITANGARTHDPGGKCVLSWDLDPDVARALMSPEIAGERLVAAFVDDGLLVNRPCPELDAHFRGSGFASRVCDLASHGGEGLFKVSYLGDSDDLALLSAALQERFSGRLSVTIATRNSVDIMAPSASKSVALTEILRHLDIPASACAAFGDGQNDIDMLSVAGQPFVMARSSPKLLSALPQASSAGSNDDAGVARTLRRLFGLPS